MPRDPRPSVQEPKWLGGKLSFPARMAAGSLLEAADTDGHFSTLRVDNWIDLATGTLRLDRAASYDLVHIYDAANGVVSARLGHDPNASVPANSFLFDVNQEAAQWTFARMFVYDNGGGDYVSNIQVAGGVNSGARAGMSAEGDDAGHFSLYNGDHDTRFYVNYDDTTPITRLQVMDNADVSFVDFASDGTGAGSGTRYAAFTLGSSSLKLQDDLSVLGSIILSSGEQILLGAATVATSGLELNPGSGFALHSGHVIGVKKTYKFMYDFATDGGATGTIVLRQGNGAIPDKFVIQNVQFDVVAALTGGAGATAALATPQSAGDLIAATVVGGAPWSTAGWKPTTVILGTTTTAIKTTASRSPTLAVAVNALTAGTFNVYVEGYQSA